MNALIWPILLLALGLILLVAEVFIPSGGLIGLLALGCLGVSVWKAFAHSGALGFQVVLALLVLMPIALLLAAHLWPKTPLARRVFLRRPDPGDELPDLPGDRLDHLIGQFGRALTPLRPSGMVDFEGRRLHGLSEEGLIPAGALVRAVQVRGREVTVRLVPDPTLNEVLA